MTTSKSPERNREANGEKSIGAHGKEVRDHARALTTSVQSTFDDVDRYVNRQMRKRPYTAIGVAAGVGFVLGGGLAPRLLSTMVSIGTRMAVDMLLVQLFGKPGRG